MNDCNSFFHFFANSKKSGPFPRPAVSRSPRQGAESPRHRRDRHPIGGILNSKSYPSSCTSNRVCFYHTTTGAVLQWETRFFPFFALRLSSFFPDARISSVNSRRSLSQIAPVFNDLPFCNQSLWVILLRAPYFEIMTVNFCIYL